MTILMHLPSKFDQKIVDEICYLLASGKTLRGICRERKEDPAWPDHSTFMNWVRRDRKDGKYKGLSKQYETARIDQAHVWADEIMDIADAKDPDWQRQRLRVDTRKWMVAKALPRVYGDKLNVSVSGGEKPVTVMSMSEEKLIKAAYDEMWNRRTKLVEKKPPSKLLPIPTGPEPDSKPIEPGGTIDGVQNYAPNEDGSNGNGRH